MPGLPFVSLNDYDQPNVDLTPKPSWWVNPDEAISAQDRNMIERQNRLAARNMAELDPGQSKGPGPRREWIEPDWGGPTPVPQPNLVSINPFDVLAHNSKLGLDSVLAQNQAERVKLDRQDEPELRTLHELTQLRIQAIQDSSATNEEKQAQLKTEELRAKEQEIKVRAKNREARTALDAADQEAGRKTVEEITARQYGINLIDGFIKDGSMAPDIGKAKQLGLAGLNVSPADFKSATPPTPKQALAEVVPTRQSYEREMGQYVMAPSKTTGYIRKSTSPERLKILKPQYRGNSKYAGIPDYKDNEELFQDATPEEIRRYYELKSDVDSLIQQERVYRDQITKRHVPTLAVAQQSRSPIAQSVALRAVAADSNDISKLSDAELRRLAGL